MKTTKIFFPVLLGILAFAMSSCSRTEYRPTDDNCMFVIKKIDGQRKWALAENTVNNQTLYTEFVYDSIFSARAAPYQIKQLFIGLKNNKYYAITSWGKLLLDGRGFSALRSIAQGSQKSSSIYGDVFHEAATPEGFLYFYLPRGVLKLFEFGPAEYLFEGKYSLIYKKGGKWGALQKKDQKEIVPCIYDGVIEVTGHYHYYLVKQNRNWSAVDENGEPLSKSQAIIKRLLKVPVMSCQEYDASKATYKRIGSENMGQIAVSPSESKYVAF